jgi:hypothetical protein
MIEASGWLWHQELFMFSPTQGDFCETYVCEKLPSFSIDRGVNGIYLGPPGDRPPIGLGSHLFLSWR